MWFLILLVSVFPLKGWESSFSSSLVLYTIFFFFPGFWSQLEPRFFYRKKKEKKTKKYQSLDFVCSAFLKFGCREVHTKDNKLSDDLMSELWDQEF